MVLKSQLASAAVVQALRGELGLTQLQVAELAGVDRVEIVNVEKGRNKATSARMRDGLAAAFHLSGEEMSAALTGSLSVEAAVKAVRTRVKAAGSRRHHAA